MDDLSIKDLKQNMTHAHRPRISSDQYFFSEENINLLIGELGAAVAERQGQITPVDIPRDDELCRRIIDIAMNNRSYLQWEDYKNQVLNAMLLRRKFVLENVEDYGGAHLNRDGMPIYDRLGHMRGDSANGTLDETSSELNPIFGTGGTATDAMIDAWRSDRTNMYSRRGLAPLPSHHVHYDFNTAPTVGQLRPGGNHRVNRNSNQGNTPFPSIGRQTF
jgi:hypothetical protein